MCDAQHRARFFAHPIGSGGCKGSARWCQQREGITNSRRPRAARLAAILPSRLRWVTVLSRQ